MSIDFEQVLLWATIIAGFIVLLDVLFFARQRKLKASKSLAAAGQVIEAKPHSVIEYARSFFPILLIVFLLRSFLFEPFRIPSSSLEPTLLIGDFILTNKYTYGLKLPIFRTTILKIGSPQRGDIIVFRWPPNKHYYFIKRIVGIPGDRIDYIDKMLIINGQQAIQMTEPILPAVKTTQRENGDWMRVLEKQENLLGVRHQIYQEPNKPAYNFQNINVPERMYLVMGDNRDSSADSRYWGFVPEENIVGKASWVWMSWDPFAAYGIHKIRWYRIGKRIE